MSHFISIRHYRGEAARHQHDFHQIVLPRQGTLELEVAGREGRVAQGSGAFIFARAQHVFLAKGTNAFIVIDLPHHTDAAVEVTESFGKKPFFTIERPVQGLLDYASAKLDHTGLPETIQKQWIALLIDSLTQTRGVAPSPEVLMLRRALAFMKAQIAMPIKIIDIAKAVGVCESRLYALFRQYRNQSPHGALIQLRVEAACRLLATTYLSIAEIALRTGHADQSVLTRRLRLARGVTPATFRRAGRCNMKLC